MSAALRAGFDLRIGRDSGQLRRQVGVGGDCVAKGDRMDDLVKDCRGCLTTSRGRP